MFALIIAVLLLIIAVKLVPELGCLLTIALLAGLLFFACH